MKKEYKNLEFDYHLDDLIREAAQKWLSVKNMDGKSYEYKNSANYNIEGKFSDSKYQ